MNVGILGSAFDPITKGHMDVAEYVVENTDIDSVWLSPCFAHLSNKEMAPPQTRMDMCKAACKDNNKIFVFNYEIRNKLRGSTFEFTERLQKEYKQLYSDLNINFSFILGMDNANEIETFYEYKKLINIIRMIVVPRKGVSATHDWYFKKPHIYLPNCNVIECSSSMVRESVEDKDLEVAKKLLHKDVFNIIKKNRLYERNLLYFCKDEIKK